MIEIRRETAKEVAAVRRIHEKACMIPILDRTATRGVSGTARYRKEFDEAL